ncbi:MAG: coproporphyrinogen III oxidase, partial [Ginsengibacter sp.]
SDSEWESHLALMIQKNVPHLACYALTVEPKTPLAKLIRLNKSPDVDSDVQARQFLLLMKWMRDAGYEHYEISNFAKAGMRSKHNSNYWNCGTYTGMGPSAHSYDGEIRKWNVSNNALYIQSITSNKIPFEAEVLTLRQRLNEYIMTSLRTIEGLDLDKIHKDYSDAKCMELRKNSQKFIDRKLMVADQHRLILNDEGKLFADGIAADLFFDE